MACRVVFIDDHPDEIADHIAIAKRRGFDVADTISTTDQALDYCWKKKHADIIVQDMMMPAGPNVKSDPAGLTTGAYLLGKMRAENIQTPVILLSQNDVGLIVKNCAQKYLEHCKLKGVVPVAEAPSETQLRTAFRVWARCKGDDHGSPSSIANLLLELCRLVS